MKCVRVELHNTLREGVNYTKWQARVLRAGLLTPTLHPDATLAEV